MLELVGLVAAIALLAGLRWAIHRSLAPERVVETQTPGDVGMQHQDVRIPSENGKSLFGWLIPAKRQGRAPAVVLLHGWGGNAETLLVHGAEDDTVPVSEAHAIHANRSGDHVHLKVVAGSHDDYADLDKELPLLVEFLLGVVKNTNGTSSKSNNS